MSLYPNSTARVYTSSKLSDPFVLSNGTRQGCPLSLIIFSLVIEPLVEYIRSHKSVHSIKIGTESHKWALFADDIILTITAPESSIPEIQSLLNKLGEVNTTKCFALTLNIPEKTISKLKKKFPCNWESPSITYLGIQLTSSSSRIYSSNYPALLTKVEEELN